MLAPAPMLVLQASGAVVADRLETIMWAQVAMAAVMVLCALAVLGAAVAVWLLARKVIREVEETRERLLPHVTPVLSRASTIADDVRAITAGLRDDAEGVHEAVRDLLDRSRRATDSLEERVRRFGVVLEAVQEQAEELLMDAAATAHGVHATARALREERPRVPRTPHGVAADTRPTARESK